MLFSSTDFLFVFLPVVLIGAFALSHGCGARAAMGWLVLASFVFYGWWNPVLLPLLLGSIAVNYVFGRVLFVS